MLLASLDRHLKIEWSLGRRSGKRFKTTPHALDFCLCSEPKEKNYGLAIGSFDPPTLGLWAQCASSAPNRLLVWCMLKCALTYGVIVHRQVLILKDRNCDNWIELNLVSSKSTSLMIMDLIVQLDLDLGSVPLYSQTTSSSHGKQIMYILMNQEKSFHVLIVQFSSV